MKQANLSLFSYVVRYDSGFAPNPFFGYCTLATCKSQIRKNAEIGDWVVGTGSACKEVQRGDHLVYAMKITEALTTTQYWNDQRFERKKPNLYRSWASASGDNIYEPLGPSKWGQLDSYHSGPNGQPNNGHIKCDTKVERVLISDDFVYFGGEGPKLPEIFLRGGTSKILKTGQGYQRIRNENVITEFEGWLNSLNRKGYQGEPWDWSHPKRSKK